eukprot:1251014-Pyramimonas_sp.AAC.1
MEVQDTNNNSSNRSSNSSPSGGRVDFIEPIHEVVPNIVNTHLLLWHQGGPGSPPLKKVFITKSKPRVISHRIIDR